VLGLIVERPDYGYSLLRRFDEPFGGAGFAESIVYSALGALEKEGSIEPVGERKTGAGRRRDTRNVIYGATPRGVRQFDAWMADSSPLAPTRDELRMKLVFCEPRHVPRLIELAWAQEQQYLDRLRQLQRLEERVALEDCTTLPQALEALLLGEDAAFLQMKIEQLRRMHGALMRFGPERGGRGGLRGV
jgi:DNA-binding PadR family transcriptional regulator